MTKLHNTLEILNLIQCYWPLQKASWYTVIVYTVALIFYASVGWNGLSLLNVFFGITCIHIRYFYLPYLLAFRVISLVDFLFYFGEFQSVMVIFLLTKKSNHMPLCGVLRYSYILQCHHFHWHLRSSLALIAVVKTSKSEC